MIGGSHFQLQPNENPRYHFGTHAQLKEYPQACVMAYNFAKRLKTRQGLTPYGHICKIWTAQPNRLSQNPLHHTVGLNTWYETLPLCTNVQCT